MIHRMKFHFYTLKFSEKHVVPEYENKNAVCNNNAIH